MTLCDLRSVGSCQPYRDIKFETITYSDITKGVFGSKKEMGGEEK